MSHKQKRYLAYLISRVVSRLVPFIAVVYIYGVFEPEDPRKQLTGMFMLTLALLFLLFFKDAKDKAQKMYDTKFKYAMGETKLLVVLVVIFMFIQWAKSGLFEIETLVIVLMISQAIAIYPSALHKKYVEEMDEEENNEK